MLGPMLLKRVYQPLRLLLPSRLSMSTSVNLKDLKLQNKDDISKLMECVEKEKFRNDISAMVSGSNDNVCRTKLEKSGMCDAELRQAITAGMATFLLHVEARVASSLGLGFYTIGPCGEELLSGVGLSLRQTDPSALHYRHVSTMVARQMGEKSIEDIILDRARGYVCSTQDPVTGGKHCSIGGSPYDYLVTSTLSSQAPPAVGRALAIPLLKALGLKTPDAHFPSDAVSYVSVGDGSVNNGHFLAAINLAGYAEHRKIKCPVVFGVTDNGLCISLRGYDWLPQFMKHNSMKQFYADGRCIFDIFEKSREAFAYARRKKKPAMIVYQNITRRFGHASTDRQSAYLTKEEIAQNAEQDVLLAACREGIRSGVFTAKEVHDMFYELEACVEAAFQTAILEPKISSVESLVESNSASLAVADASVSGAAEVCGRPLVLKKRSSKEALGAGAKTDKSHMGIPEGMRKHMTKVYDEILTDYPNAVYIGEDVRHGGYYLVTDGLADKFPLRVADFPPDETTLVGVGMGYAQSGLLPIVEIPYAKYLDCGGDMFFEAVIANWLSQGKQPNGLLFRLQGFDKGVFGGNYHTHNSLHMPPGLDVVCYSNGYDYVRGIRYAMKQAQAGRVVMSVDSTDLLNRRHVDLAKPDNGLLSRYPVADYSKDLTFDDVVVYSNNNAHHGADAANVPLVIVSYGNGVPTSLLAVKELIEQHDWNDQDVAVIDCPYLSDVPAQLAAFLRTHKVHHVVFADVCKESAGMPFAGMVMKMQKTQLLPAKWSAVGAANTYNPLSRTITFLNKDDIIAAALN